MLLDNLRHQQDPLGGVGGPAAGRVEPRIVGEAWSSRSSTKAKPLGIGNGADGDVAVSGLKDQIGARRGIGGCHFAADHRVLCHRLRPEIGDHRVEHREPDVLALAGPLTGKERRRDRLCRKD